MPDPSFQLQILIGRTASGDKTAFAALYRDTSAKLFAVALRITDRKEVAEEVLQESFVAIWQRAGEYDPQRGSAMSWLGTIVRHNAIDHLRRRGSRPEGRQAPVELLDTLAAGDASDRGAGLRALQRCLGELEEAPRRAVMLAYLYGFTREELAGRLAVPIGTVKSWLSRSLDRLKRCLDP